MAVGGREGGRKQEAEAMQPQRSTSSITVHHPSQQAKPSCSHERSRGPMCSAGSHRVLQHRDGEAGRGEGTTLGSGGLSLEEQGRQVHGKMERHLLHHVLGSHGDKAPPPQPLVLPCEHPHSPHARSMVADRRGWGARFSSFAAAPRSCF